MTRLGVVLGMLAIFTVGLTGIGRSESQCNSVTVTIPPKPFCVQGYVQRDCNLHNIEVSCNAEKPTGDCVKAVEFTDSSCFQTLLGDRDVVSCLNRYSNPLEEKIKTLCASKVYSCQIK